MSYFTNLGFNPATWFQYKFDVAAATPGIVYIDNVYFTSNPLTVASFEASQIKMYPNPASSNLTIEALDNIEKVSVYNMLGQEVLIATPMLQTVSLDISNFEIGVYIVKTSSNGKTASSRFIKN
jgi:hypothetical protein